MTISHFTSVNSYRPTPIQTEQQIEDVALAETEDFESAAAKLGISALEAKDQIKELEDRLCLSLFVPHSDLLHRRTRAAF